MITPADCLKKYGSPVDDVATTVNENTVFERGWMILWTLPEALHSVIPALPKSIYCNKDLVAPLYVALQNISDRKLGGEIKTWDGCFNIRKQRGATSQSIHSWACALDINAAWNQLGKQPTMSKELVACFTDAGFDWGGNWKRLDGMHFQLSKLPNDGTDNRVVV